MSFPSSIDSFAGFIATQTLAADNHAAQHNQEQAAIVALETKMGSGASTPTNGLALVGTSVGASRWGQIPLSTGTTGVLSISQGGTGIGSSTGTGSVVLQNAPTINNPAESNGTYNNATILTPNITYNNGSVPGVAITGNSISSSQIQPAGISYPSLSTDNSWSWESWIPSMTNFTPGTGGEAGVTGKYIQIGKTVFFKIQGILGTSAESVSGSISFSLPEPAVAVLMGVDGTKYQIVGSGVIAANGVNVFGSSAVLISTTVATLVVATVGTYLQPLVPTSSTVPYTWTTNGSFYISGSYEAA